MYLWDLIQSQWGEQFHQTNFTCKKCLNLFFPVLLDICLPFSPINLSIIIIKIKMKLFRFKEIFRFIAITIVHIKTIASNIAFLWLNSNISDLSACDVCLKKKSDNIQAIISPDDLSKHKSDQTLRNPYFTVKHLSLSKWFAKSCHSRSCAHKRWYYFLILRFILLTAFQGLLWMDHLTCFCLEQL